MQQTVLVQAAPSVGETEYLLGIADVTPHVAKVVGWIDFEDTSQRATLERLSRHPKFAGVRPMIQDIEDDDWMLRADVQWAFETLIELDLTFDCLGFPRHLKNFHSILTRYPEMRAVVDHCMKPQFRAHSEANMREWAAGVSALAQDTGAFCKLSGLVTEADEDWSDHVLRPYTNHIMDEFGPDRVMWGSDWPVVNLRCSYSEWHAQARRLTDSHAPLEQDDVFGGAARRFYQIP